MKSNSFQTDNNINYSNSNSISSNLYDRIHQTCQINLQSTIVNNINQQDTNYKQTINEENKQESSSIRETIKNNSSTYQNNDYQLTFNPYQWPSNIEVAQIHERATSIGQDLVVIQSPDPNMNVFICTCCNKNSKKQIYNWFTVDVAKELGDKYGSAVPLLFELIKYYSLCIFIIFCINGIYSIYTYIQLCNEFPHSCQKMLGFLPIVDHQFISSHLDSTENTIFQWLNFSSFIMILVCQIFVDQFCKYRERKIEKNQSLTTLKTAKERTLLISGIPKHKTEEEVIQYLKEKSMENTKGKLKLDIVDFFFVRDYSKFHELFEKRTKLYFKYRPLLLSDDKKSLKEIEQVKNNIGQTNQKLHDAYNINLKFKGKAFITLRTHTQARDLKKIFPKTNFRKGYMLFLNMLKNIQCFKNCVKRKENQIDKMLMMQWAPEAKEIIWENLGIKNIDKMKLITFAFVLSLVVAIASGISLIFLQKVIPQNYIAIFNIIANIFYAILLQYLAEKKKGKTTRSKAYFIMSKQAFFILILFVLLPVLYYCFSHVDSNGTRTYQLFIYFLVNIGILFLFVLINGQHRVHASFQKKIAKNPEIAKKYCQKALHLKIQKPEFELEQRMIGVMILWTFSIIHAFICAYTLIFSLLFLFFLYLCAKKMLFTQYTIYSYKKLYLFRKFLKFYSICFSFAVLFMFQISYQTQLQKILAGVVFVIVYLGYLILSHIYQSHLIKQRIKNLLLEPLIENNNEEYIQPPDSYSVLFCEFLKRYQQPYLEKEIQNSLEINNPFHLDIQIDFANKNNTTVETSKHSS